MCVYEMETEGADMRERGLKGNKTRKDKGRK
jgi:hypothetical protein